MRKLLSFLDSKEHFHNKMPAREYLLSEAVRVTQLGIWCYFFETDEIYWSDETYKCYGKDKDEYEPTKESFFELIHPDDRAAMSNWIVSVKNGETPGDLKARTLMPDGTIRYIHGGGELLKDDSGNPTLILGTVQDITSETIAEKRIHHLNRVYKLLSEINNLIVHTKDQQELFERATCIALENGEYKLVRICLADEQTGVMNIAAQCSSGNGEYDSIRCATIDTLSGENPYGKELLAGECIFINNIGDETRIHSCEACAMKSDCKSVAIFPLRVFEKTIGLISFFSDEIGFFDEEELRLLNEVSEDISFATETMRVEEQRKVAEATLSESENRYRLILENSMDAIMLTSVDGNVYSANRAACDMFGRTEEEICSLGRKGLVDVTDPRLATLISDRDRFGFAKGELTFLRSDGTTFQGELSSSVFTNSYDEKRTSMIIRDITERVSIQKTLRENEERYRMLFDSNPLPVWVYDVETLQYLSVNDAAILHYGYSREEFLSMTLKDIRPAEDVPRLLEDVEKVRDGLSSIGIWRHKKKDGTLIFVEIVSDDFEYSGRKARIVLTNDITERQRLEAAKNESEKKYREVIENANEIIYTTDVHGFFLYVNPAGLRQAGYSLEELKQRKYLDLVHPEHQARVKRHYYKQFLERTLTTHIEYKFCTKNGDIRWFDQNSTLIIDEGSIIGFQLIARDITDRKQAEETVRESEARYRTLFDGMMDGVYRSTHEGKFVDVNQALVKMFGYTSKEEMLGVDIKKDLYFAEEDRESHFLDINEEKIEIFRMRQKNGSEIWVEDHGRYIHDEQGNVQFHEGILRDVTERKHAEIALRESGKRLHLAAIGGNVGLWEWDTLSNKLIWSDFLKTMFGFEVGDELTLDDFMNSILPEDRKGTENAFIKAIAKETEYNQDYRIRLNDGRVRWVNARGKAMYDENGTPYKMFGTGIDITERKEIENSLVLLKKAVNASNDIIFTTDPNGLFTFVNPSFVRLYGYEPEELLGKVTPRILKSGKYGHDVYEKLWGTISRGDVFKSEVMNKTKTGQEIYVDVSINPILDEHEVVTGYLAIQRDQTEKKKMEQDFRQIQKMESIGTLAGGIAHDFNNILAIMIGHASLLQQTQMDRERLKKSVEAILKAGDRGAGLVRQLLTFARKTDSTMENIPLNSLVKEIIKLLHEILPKTISIKPLLELQLPLLHGDITQLHQLIMNLCVNARDAMMPEGGTLTITTARVTGESLRKQSHETTAEEYIKLSVADTGCGIDAQTRQRMFEPFFTTKEIGKGTGLGLSTAYGVVQSHSGIIMLESEVGKGTTFHIFLPVQQQEGTESKKRTESTTEPEGGTETILLVEDEHGLRDLTKLILEQKGYTVLTAEDGEQGLAEFGKNRESISIVVSDIDMPKLNGYQMFLKLKEHFPDVCVILASGFMEPQLKAEMLEAGVKELIHKPYDTKEMFRAIREILKGK